MTVADTAPAARPLGVSVTAEGPRPQRSLKVLFVNDYLPQEMLGIMWLSRSIKDAGHQTLPCSFPTRTGSRSSTSTPPTSSASR